MASFQARIRGETLRKEKIKTIVLFRSNLSRNKKLQKKYGKTKKN